MSCSKGDAPNVATSDQVKALVRSHAEGDDSHFYAVAMQVAARAAKSGQVRFAQELRDVVDGAKAATQHAGERSLRPVPFVQPKGDLAGLLGVSYPNARMSDLMVDGKVRDALELVLTEQRQQDRLRQHGFEPLHSLLLVGPPGTGKTLSAGVIAGELRLPLFLIRLEALITKFMGETAAKLRLIFDAVDETRGVYLFDEVDALAGDRSSTNDVGEIRRVLNSFLQFLEHETPPSIIVAATNHPQLLDRAIFRRFGAVIEYPLPTVEIARAVIRNRLATVGTRGLSWKAIDAAAQGLSHAELTLACEHVAKRAILAGEPRVTTGELVSALKERHRTNGR
jgi:SpoVK/Ycf46/Vps4 family AAA+-type ATPase